MKTRVIMEKEPIDPQSVPFPLFPGMVPAVPSFRPRSFPLADKKEKIGQYLWMK